MPNTIELILTTVPDTSTAKTISIALIEENLAACVQIHPAIESVYQWQGNIEISTEIPMTIKTRISLCPAVEQLIKAKHPYDIPEIIFLSAQSSNDYYAWLQQSCLHKP